MKDKAMCGATAEGTEYALDGDGIAPPAVMETEPGDEGRQRLAYYCETCFEIGELRASAEEVYKDIVLHCSHTGHGYIYMRVVNPDLLFVDR